MTAHELILQSWRVPAGSRAPSTCRRWESIMDENAKTIDNWSGWLWWLLTRACV